MICKSSLRRIPIVIIIKYYINPSMEYLVPIWWPSVSKIVQKHYGTRFSHCCSHCKTVSNSVCLSEGATITKGGRGLPRGQFNCSAVLTLAICSLSSQELWHLFFFCLLAQIKPKQQGRAGGTESAEEIWWNSETGGPGTERFQSQRLWLCCIAPRHYHWCELTWIRVIITN